MGLSVIRTHIMPTDSSQPLLILRIPKSQKEDRFPRNLSEPQAAMSHKSGWHHRNHHSQEASAGCFLTALMSYFPLQIKTQGQPIHGFWRLRSPLPFTPKPIRQ
jgi:hypothetical protein